jgi:hypothetical protein
MMKRGLAVLALGAWAWISAPLCGCGFSFKNPLEGCTTEQGCACHSFCDSTCHALDVCNIEKPTADCAGECVAGLGATDCSTARPPDQLTCPELQRVYDCAQYCTTLCTRGPECGTFDSSLCVEGCAAEQPTICNTASVPARSCEQLKPELRLYEDNGRAQQSGGEVVSFSSPKAFGLCRTGTDCELPLSCLAATNTCGPCEADADCARDAGSQYACAPQKECIKVACLTDGDCYGHFCDTQRHACIDCRMDADCKEYLPGCNAETAKCVMCTRDEHCTGTPFPRCNTATNRCAECVSNADCSDPSSPRCDLTGAGFCASCQSDADCTSRTLPACASGRCVACVIDAHCKDPAHPACDPSNEICVECIEDRHCAPGKTCDLLAKSCR